MKFPTERQLGAYVQNAMDNCATPKDFEEWLNKNSDKHTVIDVLDEFGESLTYSASDLAELI